MLRIALIITLLASLLFIVRQFNSTPAPVPAGEQARARTRPEPLPGSEIDPWQSQEPRVVPEIYDGYLFVEERKLEEGDIGFGQAGPEAAEETLAGLEQLFYSGSLIVGERRQALVTFQENTRPKVQAPRAGRRGSSPAPQTDTFQHKVLLPGDRFLGYLVVAIEPEKIVFEKGGEKVEKFLFDQNKKRLVVDAARTAPGQTQTQAQAQAQIRTPAQVQMPVVSQPPGVALVAPSAATRAVVPPNNLPARVQVVPGGDAAGQAAAPTRRVRRSQRLLGVNPPGMPPEGSVP